MRFRIATAVCLAALAGSGCDRAPKLASLDLSGAGLDATVDAPVNAIASKKGSFGYGVSVTGPKGYTLHITPGKQNIAEAKKSCENASQKNCKVVVDSPDAIVAEWRQLGRKNYLVDVAVSAAGTDFSCSNEPLGVTLESRATAESMIVTCKSLSVRTLPKAAAAKTELAATKAPSPSVAVASAPALTSLSLRTTGFPKTIDAPAVAIASVRFGALHVSTGDAFHLEVRTTPVDLARWKASVSTNTVNKLHKFVVESAEVLLYESQVLQPEFHFVANVKVGNKTFSCEDSKGPLYTQQQAETMLKACQSLAP
jgi:hypothetical protein